MSGLFSSKKTEKQETQIDPRIYNEVLQNLQLARQISQIPFEPYQGLMVAPFTQSPRVYRRFAAVSNRPQDLGAG